MPHAPSTSPKTARALSAVTLAREAGAARRGQQHVGRFETESGVTRDEDFAFDDGWGGGEEAAPTRTTVERVTSRTILARNTSPDISYDCSIDPYRGFEHSCSYCLAWPTNAFLGLSPGPDFETRLFAKPDEDTLLAATLCKPSYKCHMIAIGANTDPYQSIGEDLGITRGVLKVLSAFNYPVGIVTKDASVTRDLDLLADLASRGLQRRNSGSKPSDCSAVQASPLASWWRPSSLGSPIMRLNRSLYPRLKPAPKCPATSGCASQSRSRI